MKYNPRIVRAVWAAAGLPAATAEYQFAADLGRKWRFDFAWPEQMVALEVQGGIWTRGRHTRGAALKLEWEKLNTAAIMGWRILFCEPSAVTSHTLTRQLRAALEE